MTFHEVISPSVSVVGNKLLKVDFPTAMAQNITPNVMHCTVLAMSQNFHKCAGYNGNPKPLNKTKQTKIWTGVPKESVLV